MYKSETECLQLANKLIVDLNISIPRLSSKVQLNGFLYTIIFERLFGFALITSGDEENMFSILRKRLEEILGSNLDHIKIESLCTRDMHSHFQLLEVLDSCDKYLPKRKHSKKEYIPKAVQTSTSQTTSSNNSVSSTHSSVISCQSSNEKNSVSSFSICDCPDIIRATPEFAEYKNTTNSDDEGKRYEPVRITHHTKSSEITNSMFPPKSIISSLLPSHISKPKPIRGFRKTSFSSKVVPRKIIKRIPTSPQRPKLTEETENEIKDIHSDLYEKLQALTIENFALDIGKQLHATLQMKQKTKQILQHIEKMNDLVDNPTTNLKPVVKQKSRQIKSSKTASKSRKPIVNTAISVSDIYPKKAEIPRCVLKVMREYDSRQQKVIANLNEDLKSSEGRLVTDFKEAIMKQMRKSVLLRDDLQHMQNLDRVKSNEIEHLTEAAIIREWRLERAKVHKFVENYHREMLSKLKSVQAREEQMLREEFFRRLKRQKEELLEFKNEVKEEEIKELRKQRMFLEAFETFYSNNLDMLKQNINEQQSCIKNHLLHRKTSLNKLHTEYQLQLYEHMRRICK